MVTHCETQKQQVSRAKRVSNNKYRSRSELVTRRKALRAYSILEIILAMGIFTIIASGAVATVVHAFSATRLGEEETYAAFRASEGLEAVRAIQDRDFTLLTNGPHGLSRTSGEWEFFGSEDALGKYTREITISDVYRDPDSGYIVSQSEPGAELDPDTKGVESLVEWDFTSSRHNSSSLKTYFTYWEAPMCNWAAAQQYFHNLDGNRDALDIEVVGDYAYTITNNEEFYIIDVSTPSSPVRVGKDTYNIPFFQIGLNGIAVSGNYAYVGARDIMETFPWAAEIFIENISNPASPTHTSYSLPGLSTVYDVAVSGNYLYVVTSAIFWYPEFTILDITNPASPSRVGWLEVGTAVSGVFVADNRAYIATDNDSKELIIIDISNKSSPQEIGSYDTPSASGDGADVFVAGDTAYLVTEDNSGATPEFYILNVSNPASISLVGSRDISASVNGVVVSGDYAFLATDKSDKEAIILDISSPASPAEEASHDFDDGANKVAVGECVSFWATDVGNGEMRVLEP